MRVKTKTINIRVEEPFYEFLNNAAKKVGIDRSELVRRILEHYFHALFLGQLPKRSLKDMREEFIGTFATKEVFKSEVST